MFKSDISLLSYMSSPPFFNFIQGSASIKAKSPEINLKALETLLSLCVCNHHAFLNLDLIIENLRQETLTNSGVRNWWSESNN